METDTKKSKPTKKVRDIRRKKVIKAIVDGRGNSVSAAMREAGYSNAYAHNPQTFLNTKPTQDLLEQYFPDDLLFAKTRELMDASEIEQFVFPQAKDKKKKPLTNDEIKYIVEAIAGCTLIYIRDSEFPPGRIAFFRAPAHKARKDGIEIAAKLKGSFKADGMNPNDKNPLSQMSDTELAAAIKEAKDVLKKRI